MAIRFVHKRKFPMPRIVSNGETEVSKAPDTKVSESTKETKVEPSDENAEKKNNVKKKKDDMLNENQISAIESAVNSMSNSVKVVRQDKGLIERTESSKIILTEDNRQVLND